jgi:nitrate reductase cytochrome c-type subunit
MSLYAILSVLLLVAHAVKYVGLDINQEIQVAGTQERESVQKEENAQGESEQGQESIVTQEDVQPPVLPSPKREKRISSDGNEQCVRIHEKRQMATVREVVQALSIGTSTANKWMRKAKEQ